MVRKSKNGTPKLRTLHGYVMLRFDNIPTEVKLPSGLFVPYSVGVAHQWRLATIAAVGSGIPTKEGGNIPYDFEVGDVVLVNRIFGDRVNRETGETETKEYRIVSYDQIEGIVEVETDDEFWIEI